MSTRRGEDGFSLVELTIATAVLAVVMAMTYMIAATVVKQAVTGTNNGITAETAQSQMATVEQYLRGAISPASAQTEYKSQSINPCVYNNGNPAPSTTSPVQYSYDYFLEVCSAPSNRTACTSSDVASGFTACPHLYVIFLDHSTCNTTYGECTLKVVDLTASATGATVYSAPYVRCPVATCQNDLSSSATSVPAPSGCASGHECNGASPTFPYFFTYYSGAYSSANQIDGSANTSVQTVNIDWQSLTQPPAAATSSQKYTEISDAVWLAGAAQRAA